MPWVEKYASSTGADGKPRYRYRGGYRDTSGKRRSKSFDTKGAAARWAGEEEAKVHRGQRSNTAGARMRWAEWADRWWAAKRIEPGTRRRNESRLNAHVRPRWADVPLVAITRMDIQTWVNQLAERRSPSTTRQCYYLLSNSLREAVNEGVITASPCVGVVLPSQPHGQERFLTDVEAGKLLYHLDGRWRVFGELLLGTGLRLSEACGLHASRVDLDNQRLQVIETWDPADKAMKPYPKSRRRRVVPLSDELAALLAEWLDQEPNGKTCGKPHRAGRCPGGLLIAGPQGGPVHGPNFERRQWEVAVQHSGIGAIRIHDLRHSYASRLLQQGVSLERVQLLLGHESLTTTQRYAHLVRDDWDSVRAALSTSVTAARAAQGGGPRLRAL